MRVHAHRANKPMDRVFLLVVLFVVVFVFKKFFKQINNRSPPGHILSERTSLLVRYKLRVLINLVPERIVYDFGFNDVFFQQRKRPMAPESAARKFDEDVLLLER